MLIWTVLLAACSPANPVRGDADADVGVAPQVGSSHWFFDADGDGYGDARSWAPAGLAGAVRVAGDCDDADPGIHPDAPERWADGLTDNDCDGRLEGVTYQYGGAGFGGPEVGAQAGRRVGRAGDIDGDGLDEALIAAPYAFGDAGVVYRVEGAEGGDLTGWPSITASMAGALLGASVDGGEDLDGDGVPDVLIGATGVEGGRGACYVVSGARWAAEPDLTLPGDALAVVSGYAEEAYLGAACVFVPDATGDGVADVAVSAPWWSTRAAPRSGVVGLFDGAALVALGEMGIFEAWPVWAGNSEGVALGNVVEAAGDLDGDGMGELLISSATGPAAWLVSTVPAGAESPMLDVHATVLVPTDGRPRMVGDIDGDGVRDLVVLEAEARFFTGLSAGGRFVEDDAWGTVYGAPDGWFTDAVDLGDLDGDGRAETLLTSPGASGDGVAWAGVVRGGDLAKHGALAATDLILQATPGVRGTTYGYRAALVGDVLGDGGDAVVLGGWADDDAGALAGGAVMSPVPR